MSDLTSQESLAVARQAAERMYNETELKLGDNLIEGHAAPQKRELIISMLEGCWLSGRQHGLASAMKILR